MVKIGRNMKVFKNTTTDHKKIKLTFLKEIVKNIPCTLLI